jgi:hypothetical protein
VLIIPTASRFAGNSDPSLLVQRTNLEVELPFSDANLPAFFQPLLRPVDQLLNQADRDLQYHPSLAISPRNAGSRTSTSSLATRHLLMRRPQDTVSTTRFAMVRSITGITWSVTGNRRSSSTSGRSRRTTTFSWSARYSDVYLCDLAHSSTNLLFLFLVHIGLT